MGEAKRRREAVARGEPDPGPVGIKSPGRGWTNRALGLRHTAIDDEGNAKVVYYADAMREATIAERRSLRAVVAAVAQRFRRRFTSRAQAR